MPALVYHWIAKLNKTGECIPQFDHDTGIENKFHSIPNALWLCVNCHTCLYHDETGLPQIGPCQRCGKSKWRATVEPGTLKSFGWYPVSEQIAKKANEANSNVCVISRKLPAYRLPLEPRDWLIAFRRNEIKLGTNKRMCEWQLGIPWRTGDERTDFRMQQKHDYRSDIPQRFVSYYVLGYRRPGFSERLVWIDYTGQVRIVERPKETVGPLARRVA